MFTREAPIVILSKEQVRLGDCATIDATQGTLITGDVIDRLQFQHIHQAVLPFISGKGWGTTFADKHLTVSIKLQHGDSSGGGDMADFSTGQAPRDLVFQTSAETTPMAGWSTGQQRIYSADSPYALTGAKRYLRPAGTIAFPGVTTSTADANVIKTVLGLALLAPDERPTTLTETTSTST